MKKALGKEDLLIMKCFAHRQKDVGHAKMLIKKGAELKLVEKQIDLLRDKWWYRPSPSRN